MRLAVLGLLLVGCAAGPDVKKTEARLQVISVPEAASVYVDGHYFGRAKVLAEVPQALKPGKHFVTVLADDHFPHDLELDLEPGTTTVRIELRPIPP